MGSSRPVDGERGNQMSIPATGIAASADGPAAAVEVDSSASSADVDPQLPLVFLPPIPLPPSLKWGVYPDPDLVSRGKEGGASPASGQVSLGGRNKYVGRRRSPSVCAQGDESYQG
jgi:hypothetical protein